MQKGITGASQRASMDLYGFKDSNKHSAKNQNMQFSRSVEDLKSVLINYLTESYDSKIEVSNKIDTSLLMCNSAVVLASQFSSIDLTVKLDYERRNNITYSLIKSRPYFSCIGLFMYYLKDFRRASSFKSNILASQYKDILDNVTVDKELEIKKVQSYNNEFRKFQDNVISPESQIELEEIKERNENIRL